jgi:hypothetical protein
LYTDFDTEEDERCVDERNEFEFQGEPIMAENDEEMFSGLEGKTEG